MPRRAIYDRWLVFVTVLLAAGGLLMVGSASSHIAMHYSNNPSAFLIKHGIHAALGFLALGLALYLRYQDLDNRRAMRAIFIVCIASLVIVLAMPPIGGARRWIVLGPLTIQPSEFAKLCTVLFMAYILSRREEQVNDVWAVPLPCLFVVGGLSFLIMIEPDLGSAVVLALVASAMIFVAGLRWKYLGALAGLGLAGLVVSLIFWPYRLQRLLTHLDPDRDPLGAGFQLNQSLIAVGRGGLAGVGFGHGQQKAFYIPAAHTDFIFSIIGEELGLIGTGLLLLAFLVLFWRGIRAAVRAPDRFGFYLAFGVTSLLVLQALINMGVCVGLLPTKGLPLPFISYGGSSLLVSMLAVGLLINVSQHSN